MKKTILNLVAILVIAATVAGCGAAPTALPTASVPPTAAPTMDQQPTFAAIQTQAVETAVAQMTMNAPAATATTAATYTPAPTATPLPPVATATATLRPPTLTPAKSYTPTQQAYSCTITELSPKSSDKIGPNADFDGRWVVKNTGSETWTRADFDVKYVAGTKFQTKVDIIDLPVQAAQNESVTVVIDMKAPDKAGNYYTQWNVVRGDKVFCALGLTINVSAQ